jgi:hypothetical protein
MAQLLNLAAKIKQKECNHNGCTLFVFTYLVGAPRFERGTS